MEFEDFRKKYKCSISRRYEQRVRYHNRPIERKMYFMYINIKTMLPFKPRTPNDCRNCIAFSCDISSDNAKKKAYEFIKEKGSLDL